MQSGGEIYPAFLVLKGVPVLVVGGGEVAYRKAVGIIETGCALTVVAPTLIPAFERLLARENVRWQPRPYRQGEAGEYFLVLSATDDPITNQQVYRDAHASGRLVNVADRPELCTFFVPATLHRGPLKIAVSTSGACPALSRHLRLELEAMLPERYATLLEWLEYIRSSMRLKIRSADRRRVYMARIVASKASRDFLEGREDLLARMVAGWERARPR